MSLSPNEWFRLLGALIVVLFGGGALWGFFTKQKEGFGPYNLRVLGIILVATFAIILTLLIPPGGVIDGAIGLLGTIAGYIFGKNETK